MTSILRLLVTVEVYAKLKRTKWELFTLSIIDSIFRYIIYYLNIFQVLLFLKL